MTWRAAYGLFALLTAAIASAPPTWAGKADDTLNVAFFRDVRTVDGLYSTIRENDMLGLLTDDALFYVEPKEMKPVPLAAKSFEQTDDRTLDITLREDVTFHDGSPLTAEDVVYTYTWILKPESNSPYTSRFQFWLESLEALGPLKVRFRLKQPYPMALYDLAYYSKLRKKGAYDGGVDPARVNGTGPYRLVSFEPGKRVVLERFEGYRADSPKGKAHIKTLNIRTIPDWSTQAAELMSGGIHWAFQMPTEVAENLGASGRAQLVPGADMRIVFMTLDAKGATDPNGPLTKLAVRRAINHAIEKDSIVKYLVRGQAQVIHAACHPVQFGCPEDVTSYPYDKEKAKALLKEAGYPDGFTVQMWASREKPVVEAIASQLAEVGIKVDLRFVKAATLGQARGEGQIPIQFTTWGSYSIPDAGAIAPDHWRLDTDRNQSGDEKVAALIEAASSTYDEAEREKNFHAAFKRIAEQAYWVPLYTFSINYAVSNEVEFSPPRDGMARLYELKWKE